jgi:sugar lactone lactonase YvrE
MIPLLVITLLLSQGLLLAQEDEEAPMDETEEMEEMMEEPEPEPVAPQIISINFPRIIPPNGSEIQGVLEFNDDDQNTRVLELNVIRAYDFASVQIVIFSEDQAPGVVPFRLSSPITQPVALEAVLMDEDGLRSEPVRFHFAAVEPSAQVVPGVYFMNTWGQKGKGPGEFAFEGPHGVTIGPDNNIYATDEGNNRIQVFTNQGEYITEWGRFGDAPGQFKFASYAIFGPDGNIYVADSLNHRIQVFDPELNYIREWGSQGFELGNFNAPRGMAFNSFDELTVVDELNGRIQVFDINGRFVRSWGKLGDAKDDGPGEFNTMVGLDVDAQDRVFIADGFNHRIQVFDREGNFIKLFGEFGTGDAQFNDPVDVAVAPQGWMAITDSFGDRVHIWTTEGAFLRAWGTQTDTPGTGFKLPLGVSQDDFGMFYIGDHFNRRIQAFYVDIDPEEIIEANATLMEGETTDTD